MADCRNLSSPTSKLRKVASSVFSSAKLLTGLSSTASFSDGDATVVMSPKFSVTSLKCKTVSVLGIPLRLDSSSSKAKTRRIHLGILEALGDDSSGPKGSLLQRRILLPGSQQLRIQIPLAPATVPHSGSPSSPADFGIKTRQHHTSSAMFSSRSPTKKSPWGSANSGSETIQSPHVFTEEMELSEGYTCVIEYGPNPRTIHIFDDCVIECLPGINSRREGGMSSDRSTSSSPPSLHYAGGDKGENAGT